MKTDEEWAVLILAPTRAKERYVELVAAIRKEERERCFIHLRKHGRKSKDELISDMMNLAAETIRALEEEKHMHVNNQDGTDTCARCGKDLRNEIHIRAMGDE